MVDILTIDKNTELFTERITGAYAHRFLRPAVGRSGGGIAMVFPTGRREVWQGSRLQVLRAYAQAEGYAKGVLAELLELE